MRAGCPLGVGGEGVTGVSEGLGLLVGFTVLALTAAGVVVLVAGVRLARRAVRRRP